MAFYREQEQITQAEQERRDIIAKEEQRLTEQRRKYINLSSALIFLKPSFTRNTLKRYQYLRKLS